MDIWTNSIENALDQNEQVILNHEKSKTSYEELISNMKYYSDKYSPPILIPICKKILMRGNLTHTNEILVSLGSGYFVKTSSKNAQELCQKRIRDIEEAVKACQTERSFLLSQIECAKNNIFETKEDEIIEPFNEQHEIEWMKLHRLNMATHRRKENEEMRKFDSNKVIEKLNRLELEEDLGIRINSPTPDKIDNESRKQEIKKKLTELRGRKKTKCITESDIMKRLDELDQEEELEDELRKINQEDPDYVSESSEEFSDVSEDEIIDHITKNDDDQINSEKSSPSTSKTDDNSSASKRRVSFATDPLTETKILESVNTVNINFSHSYEPSIIKETSEKLENPSDVYNLFPECVKKPKPIIKNCQKVSEEIRAPEKKIDDDISEQFTKSVVLGEVIEHSTAPSTTENSNIPINRPVSKFKSMRQVQNQLNKLNTNTNKD